MDIRLLSLVALVALFGMSALAAILFLLLSDRESEKRHGPDHTNEDH